MITKHQKYQKYQIFQIFQIFQNLKKNQKSQYVSENFEISGNCLLSESRTSSETDLALLIFLRLRVLRRSYTVKTCRILGQCSRILSALFAERLRLILSEAW